MQQYMRVCAYINRDAIKNNIEKIVKKIDGKAKIMPVIKADGYGHGALDMALLLLPYADYFAVAIIDEALSLRNNGIKKPILILGYTAEEFYETAIKNDITLTVFTFNDAKKISQTAKGLGKTAKIHISVDTGMRRIGLLPTEESAKTVKKISMLENLEIEGAFTHFATSDEKDREFTEKQTASFKHFKELIKKAGVDIKIFHASNSAAIMQYNDSFDMVRPGIILYGLYPSDEVSKELLSLLPVMEIETHIAYVKDVKKGESISYGRTFFANKDMRVATIPVGYADGYPRLLSNKGRVIINGCYAPIVGRICMDQFMVDVTDIPNAKIGDIVTLMGKQGDCNVSAEEIARHAQTINYEIVCGIGKRVPRIMR